MKWVQKWGDAGNGRVPPSIITVMINLALKVGSLGKESQTYGGNTKDYQ